MDQRCATLSLGSCAGVLPLHTSTSPTAPHLALLRAGGHHRRVDGRAVHRAAPGLTRRRAAHDSPAAVACSRRDGRGAVCAYRGAGKGVWCAE
eukprot:365757-Chlamydomonas_euryale.AAC.5